MNNFSWFKQYPPGIPREIDPDKYGSIIDLFNECCAKFGSSEAFECMGKSITYHELDELSSQFAAFLQQSGHKPGERIAIQMPNLLQYPVVMFGAMRAGLIVVNTNPLYTPREMEHQFVDSGAVAIVILSNFASHLEKVLHKTAIKTVIITHIGDMLGSLKGAVVNLVVKHVKKMVPPYNLPNALSFKGVMQTGKKSAFKAVTLKGDDIAYLQYTGGTTGVSKGAMLTHRNMIANTEQISAWMVPKLKPGQEIMITALPLYHIYALTVNCLSMLKIGAKNILITNPRDMPAFLKELKKHPFTVITGVNTLFNGLLNQPDFASIDFSSLKVASGGGMAVQKAVARKWKEVTGTSLVEGYGLTETAPVLTSNPCDGNERIGTIGVPLPSTEVVILDEAGVAATVGQPGEICAQGPQVMPGYWEKPEETAKVFINGWFKTGDIGVVDEDGYFTIVDRIKDMINVSGFNVYPNEIEDTVADHPKVLEVAAVGVPDERSTEVVKIFVVKKDESLTEEELSLFCKENMTGYKRPRHIEFRKELPKSNVGKILRRLLRDEPNGKG